MSSALQEFISILTGGLQTMATSIGQAINTAVQAMFLEVDGQGAITGLSTFGGVIRYIPVV